MKKVFLALAVVAMFSFAACSGNNTEATDSTVAPETEAVEAPVENTECTEGEATPVEGEATTEEAAPAQAE